MNENWNEVLESLKNAEKKKELIQGDKYEFVRFCQIAPKEVLDFLLDEEGIELLLLDEDAEYKINGGLLQSIHGSDAFKNDNLCEYTKNHSNIDFYSADFNHAKEYMEYLLENDTREIPTVFSQLGSEVQLKIAELVHFPQEIIQDIFLGSKKKVAEYLMMTDMRVSLNDISLSQFLAMNEKGICFSPNLIAGKLMDNIAMMDNVNTYRLLMERFSRNNDPSIIEARRKKYYEEQLDSVNEEGLLPEYAMLKKKIKDSEYIDEAVRQSFNGFFDSFYIHESLFSSHVISDEKKLDEAIKKLNDYRISNMIIDYLFENIPTNTITDIGQMLKFQSTKKTLDDKDESLYTLLANIDKLPVDRKLTIFEDLKNGNMKEKFYDDYSKTKEQMVDSINDALLNEKTLPQFKDEELSKQSGVSVYMLKGEPYHALVRDWGKSRDTVLTEDVLEYRADGTSFSVDGSDLVRTFRDPHKSYQIMYDKVPPKQLIHLFPVDSYSKYIRTIEGLPPENLGTDRIVNLLSIEELTTIGKAHNELLIATPNVRRYESDFDNQLEKPKPLAIYCYDYFTKRDIESAKKLGVGIVVIDTSKYEVNRDTRLDERDTFGSMFGTKSYDYYTEVGQRDERLKEEER